MRTDELTEAERYELGRLVGNGYLTRVGTRSLIDYVNVLVAVHVRRALEDAAKDIDLSEFYDPDPRGQVSQECGHAETAAHRWLTARAAAPDPRETKD